MIEALSLGNKFKLLADSANTVITILTLF